ncbi:hypothetical protein [Seongchinamella sediminis]|uniref:hypothetical protein n=1 Tax=Seongchinamella sediminis TaxID=2283635 RepID=UPI0013C32589|nr:hypothetical protein [Seongchinamella sediminis]
MSLLMVALALAVSWLPAASWLTRFIPAATPARWALISGYACLLGLLATTLLMRLYSLLGIDWSFAGLALGSLCISALALAYPARPGYLPSGYGGQSLPLTRLQHILVVLCLALLASRLIALGLELLTRPMTAWDAKQHWARQAKVFFELKSTVPYVDPEQWLATAGTGVFTNMHPDYPIATPLLQAWMAVALGYWDNSLVNAPWLLMWLGIGLVFYAQARQAGANAAVALAACYMVLSLPYLNTQVALAGYADLLLALAYLGAVAAFGNWLLSRAQWQLALALVSAAGGLLVKNEGFYWLLSLAPGILLAVAGLRRGFALLAALALALLLTLYLLPAELAIAGHTLASMAFGYRPESWLAIYLSGLVHDNWHLAIYLLTIALVLVPFRGRTLIPLAIVVLAAISLYLILYLFTDNAHGAVNFTSLNRVALQLLPAAAFFTLAVFLAAAGNAPGENSDPAITPKQD